MGKEQQANGNNKSRASLHDYQAKCSASQTHDEGPFVIKSRHHSTACNSYDYLSYKVVSFTKQKLPVQQTPRNTDKNIHHKKTYYVSKKIYKVDQKYVTMQKARII